MAIKTYTKGTATQLSTNFKSTEFDCHGSGCCTSTKVDENLVKYLQKIRDHFGKSVNINSGYRCSKHNASVGGASKSNHMEGMAADIVVNGVKPLEVAQYAEHIGMKGIGIYSWGVHVDTRTSKYFWYDGGASNVSTFGGSFTDEEIKIDTSKVNDKAADPKEIWDFLKAKGLNDYGIAGLMGNLYAESGLKPTNLQNTYEKSLGYTDAEYTAAVDQGLYDNFVKDSAGYGLAQWTYWSRKENMLNFHKKKGKSIGDLTTQLEFLMEELEKNYTSSVLAVLKNATSVLEASNAVLLKFERPADQSTAVQNKRASFGQEYYNKYHTTTTAVVTPTAPTQGGTTKMKYNASNKPLVCMQTQSTCYKGTSKMTVKGVLWHSTGANNPNLKRYVQPSDNASDRDEMLKLLGTNSYKNDWNHISHQAGLNCWIGKLADGTVATVQTMPWDYKPWGCGSGSKGSCNNGWIQFEICEDGLTDKTYFDAIYKEACEITAYLCDMYNIDPTGTVTVNGVQVPTILCHVDSYKLGFGSNHGDVNHWFPKHGKSMETARNDVAELLKGKSAVTTTPEIIAPNAPEVTTTEMYRIRKTWEDTKSQIGAYASLKNAQVACDKAGNEYKVFNNAGEVVYPKQTTSTIAPTTPTNNFKIGDELRLIPGSKYASGGTIPTWLFGAKLYLREIRKNGDYVISTKSSGPVTGVVKPTAVVSWSTAVADPGFTPYLVQINTDVLNVRAGAGTTFKITTQVKRNGVYTIIGEKNGWGKLKSGAGWILLDYTKKV